LTPSKTAREELASWFASIGLFMEILGNPGNFRDLTDGVSEPKIDVGSGYRVYCSQRGTRLLLLLAGGDKSTQQKDIAKAITLAKHFQE
jgi:putative addiction module killer protein